MNTSLISAHDRTKSKKTLTELPVRRPRRAARTGGPACQLVEWSRTHGARAAAVSASAVFHGCRCCGRAMRVGVVRRGGGGRSRVYRKGEERKGEVEEEEQ